MGQGDGILHARPGDWLLHYPHGDYGVVSDEIFAAAYDDASGFEHTADTN